MIENTLLHFKTKAAFNTELEAGNIKDDSIVFIDESKEIWTHGTYYGCSELDLSNIATKEELASKLDAITADSNYWKRTETVNQAVSSEFASSAYADDKDNRISTTYATKTEVTTGLNGKINQNGTVTSVIAMSQSEYDALATKDPTTLYIITES